MAALQSLAGLLICASSFFESNETHWKETKVQFIEPDLRFEGIPSGDLKVEEVLPTNLLCVIHIYEVTGNGTGYGPKEVALTGSQFFSWYHCNFVATYNMNYWSTLCAKACLV
jgi:hypothetical protein